MTEIQNNHGAVLLKKNKWHSSELPQIIQIIRQVQFGSMSQREAAKKYNVTRYQVEKWAGLVSYTSDDGTIRIVDDQLKSNVIKAVYYRGMTLLIVSHQPNIFSHPIFRNAVGVWV